MSAANLDLLRSIYADWEHGDFSTADWAHPDIEYVVADGPEPGTWSGVGELAAAFRDLLGAWEDFRVRADEYREVDDERVLVLQHNSGRGKTSGLSMWAEAAIIFDLRDGKVTRCVGYMDRDRALADLGLEGQRMPEKPMTLPPNLDEIHRKFIEAANRGDIDAAFGIPLFQPDAVWDDSAIEGGTYEGLAATSP